ncbi:hypothetical protein [Arthrobacter sp. ISL-5]|uniref:hypothetical protein n=1 Tax=Arthrobacter sp. ISL-5 TaxID=2819111 RepID=UPI001BEB13C6|nr:hypothetical protein [Arthrobacter sp. ISL-5]MBT2551903.1 hypothetical protein [Arthrobacter sp. ISL-5]
MDIGNWWNGILRMVGDIWKFLTTDSFGQAISVLLLGGVGVVAWYFIRKKLEAPKMAPTPAKTEPNSSLAVPGGPPRAYSANSILQRAEKRGLWRIEPSYSPTVYSLVNTGITVATKVSITSDQDDYELDGPVYWDKISPKQHEPFSLTSPLSEPSTSLTVAWRDHERRYRETKVTFPAGLNTGGS